MQDPYAALQVARNAEPEVIAAAYRSLARKYHPDKNASDGSKERMQELNAAYEILRDPAKRKRYDRAHPFPSGRILWHGEEQMVWSGPLGQEEETGWAGSYVRRRDHPRPIPRPGFWRRNMGCVLYVAFALFVCWQVLAIIILKM
jgi:curved DNA-binding protein CbpA